MVETHEFRRLKAIFDGDGSEIREQFIFAGLLLTIFERFKKYVVDLVDGFFANHIELKDGDLKYTRGEEFKRLIKETGVGVPGQHANKEFRASLYWFYKLEAITENELHDIERIYALRNDISHELFAIVADDRKAPIKLEDVLAAYAIYLKIVRWWWKEVEATIDPDFDREKYDNTNWEEVQSCDSLFLGEVIRKALVGNATWEQIETLVREEQISSVGTQPNTAALDMTLMSTSG